MFSSTDSQAHGDAANSQAANFQFSIKFLLLATLYVAVATGIVVHSGVDFAYFFIGWGLILLNFAGAFVGIQKRPGWPFAIWTLSLVVFVISLFLPVIRFNGPGAPSMSDAAGFEALIMYAQTHISVGEFSTSFVVCHFVLTILTNISNIAMILMPLGLWRISKGKGDWFHTVILICGSTPTLLRIPYAFLREGYFVWCSCFMIAMLAKRPKGVTVAIAAGVSAVQIFYLLVYGLPQL